MDLHVEDENFDKIFIKNKIIQNGAFVNRFGDVWYVTQTKLMYCINIFYHKKRKYVCIILLGKQRKVFHSNLEKMCIPNIIKSIKIIQN
jgi:hypothetical protein